MEHYEEAASLAAESLQILKQTLGSTHESTIRAAQRLASLYDDWHIIEPEEGLDTKANELRTRIEYEISP